MYLFIKRNKANGTEMGQRDGINIPEVPAKQGFLRVTSKYIKTWCDPGGIRLTVETS